MSAVLAALAGAAASGAYNTILQSRQNAATQKNMAISNRMERKNLMDSPSLLAQGYKMAGLNPASIAGSTSFSAPSVSSHPGSPGFPVDVASPLVSAVRSDSEAKLMEAQVEKLESEKDVIDRQAARLASEDSTNNERIRSYYRFKAKEAESKKDFDSSKEWNRLANSVLDFDTGTLKALNDFEQYVMSVDDRDLKFMQNDLSKRVISEQKNNQIYKDLARLPRDQHKKFLADINEVNSQIQKLMTSSKLDTQLIDQSTSTIKKLLTDVDKTYHTDYLKLWEDGKYLGSIMTYIQSVFSGVSAGTGAAVIHAIPK